MGYTTEFYGQIAITPPFNAEEIAFIKKHNKTRRMLREKGASQIRRLSRTARTRSTQLQC